MSTSYNLNFMHPQYGTTINVDIDGRFSVQEVLEQLRLSGFMGQADGEYDLQLMGQALERHTLFVDIPALYDGAVLRLVEQPKVKVTATSPDLMLLHVKHPTSPYLLSIELPPKAPLIRILEEALERGFVAAPMAQLSLTKGQQPLDPQQSLAQNGLQAGDYVKLHLQSQETTEEAPAELRQRL